MADVSFPLDFTGGSLPANVALTRSTVGTYWDSSGVMQSAAVDTARFDYNPNTLTLRGLLIEPSAHNYAAYSHDFTHWSVGSASDTGITTGQSAPDGSSDAALVYAKATNWEHDLRHPGCGDVGNFCYSLHFKAGGYANVGCRAFDQIGEHKHARFNLSGDGSAIIFPTMRNASIELLSGSWYRAQFAFYGMGWSQLCVQPWVDPAQDFFMQPGTGDGASGIYIWGMQCEPGLKATSYYPTAAVDATRGADVCTFSIPSGISTLTYTFDDNSTQVVAQGPGAYTIPTTLNRPWIKGINGA